MPEVSQVHIDAALTNVSVAYRNPDYIADIIAPQVAVRKQSDKYYIYDAERERFRQCFGFPGIQEGADGWCVNKPDSVRLDAKVYSL